MGWNDQLDLYDFYFQKSNSFGILIQNLCVHFPLVCEVLMYPLQNMLTEEWTENPCDAS